MKILIFGSGVIGSVIGWQLQKRNEITHFVRSDKLKEYSINGIEITCCDLRKRRNKITFNKYKPNFIDSLNNIIDYDMLLLSVKSNQLIKVIMDYKEYFQKVPVFIMQNVGLKDYDDLLKLLNNNVSFIYPFITGGGRIGNKIECTIFNNYINNMVIGNIGNSNKTIEKEIFNELKNSKLKPFLSKNIEAYLKLHYVWATCALASYIKGGNYSNFTKLKTIQDSYKAMVECFLVFRKEGINSKKIFPYNLYHFPSLILAIYSQILYKTDAMKTMVEGHLTSSPDEMENMYYTLYNYCNDSIEKMPLFKSYKLYIDVFFKKALTYQYS